MFLPLSESRQPKIHIGPAQWYDTARSIGNDHATSDPARGGRCDLLERNVGHDQDRESRIFPYYELRSCSVDAITQEVGRGERDCTLREEEHGWWDLPILIEYGRWQFIISNSIRTKHEFRPGKRSWTNTWFRAGLRSGRRWFGFRCYPPWQISHGKETRLEVGVSMGNNSPENNTRTTRLCIQIGKKITNQPSDFEDTEVAEASKDCRTKVPTEGVRLPDRPRRYRHLACVQNYCLGG